MPSRRVGSPLTLLSPQVCSSGPVHLVIGHSPLRSPTRTTPTRHEHWSTRSHLAPTTKNSFPCAVSRFLVLLALTLCSSQVMFFDDTRSGYVGPPPSAPRSFADALVPSQLLGFPQGATPARRLPRDGLSLVSVAYGQHHQQAQEQAFEREGCAAACRRLGAFRPAQSVVAELTLLARRRRPTSGQ